MKSNLISNSIALLGIVIGLYSCSDNKPDSANEEKVEATAKIDTTNILVACYAEEGSNGTIHGWLDTNLKVIVGKYEFEEVKPFSEGLAPVKMKGKWGYVNLKGEVVIPCTYDNAEPFSEGLALVENIVKTDYDHAPTRHNYYIDNNGKQAFNLVLYPPCSSFNNGYAHVYQLAEVNGSFSSEEGYINKKGEFKRPDNIQLKELVNSFQYKIQPYGGQITSSIQFDKYGKPKEELAHSTTKMGFMDVNTNSSLTDAKYNYVGYFHHSFRTPDKYFIPRVDSILWGNYPVADRFSYKNGKNNEVKVEESSEAENIDSKKEGDFYVINDPDGYSNLREKPNGKVVKKVYEEEMFQVIGEEQGFKKVKLEDGTIGYIHASRVVKYK